MIKTPQFDDTATIIDLSTGASEAGHAAHRDPSNLAMRQSKTAHWRLEGPNLQLPLTQKNTMELQLYRPLSRRSICFTKECHRDWLWNELGCEILMAKS